MNRDLPIGRIAAEPSVRGTLERELTSTDHFPLARFRAHGRVDYEMRGPILYSTATGPFNRELLEALFELAKATFPVMAAHGRWVNLALFRHSALCTPEVLDDLQQAMRQLVALGVAPHATAFVLPPEVEGASIMGRNYIQAYNQAGANLRCFTQQDQAQAWLQSVLTASGA